MIKNRQKVDYDAVLNSILLVAGIIILGVIVVVVTRFQRGLLAFVLSALAGGLLIFWLFELRRTFRQSVDTFGKARERKWTYDLISSDEEITLVAEVPWPDDNVSVQLEKGRLKVRSSKDFAKDIELSDPVELIGSTCVNGILNVRLRRISKR